MSVSSFSICITKVRVYSFCALLYFCSMFDILVCNFSGVAQYFSAYFTCQCLLRFSTVLSSALNEDGNIVITFRSKSLVVSHKFLLVFCKNELILMHTHIHTHTHTHTQRNTHACIDIYIKFLHSFIHASVHTYYKGPISMSGTRTQGILRVVVTGNLKSLPTG